MSFFTKSAQLRRTAKEARLVAIENRMTKLEQAAKSDRDLVDMRLGETNAQKDEIAKLHAFQDRVSSLEKQIVDLLILIQGLERRSGDSRGSLVTPIGFVFGGNRSRTVSTSSSVTKEVSTQLDTSV